jgi:hypothetical protein
MAAPVRRETAPRVEIALAVFAVLLGLLMVLMHRHIAYLLGPLRGLTGPAVAITVICSADVAYGLWRYGRLSTGSTAVVTAGTGLLVVGLAVWTLAPHLLSPV